MDQTHGLPINLHEEALQTLCRQYGVARLALFGSVLREDFTDHSDIDVLCTLAPDSPARGFEWIRLKQSLEDLWGRPVDLIKPYLLDALIRDEVLAEERIIYVAPSRCALYSPHPRSESQDHSSPAGGDARGL